MLGQKKFTIKEVNALELSALEAYKDRLLKVIKSLEHRSSTHSELCVREHAVVEKLTALIEKGI